VRDAAFRIGLNLCAQTRFNGFRFAARQRFNGRAN
jgi:hypothetical protein